MKKVLFTLILSLALQSCDWIKSLGPEEPFFCKINGQKFRPDKDTRSFGWGGGAPINISWNKDTGYLFISVTNSPRVVSLILSLDTKIVEKMDLTFNGNTNSSKGIFTPEKIYSKPTIDLISTSGKASITKVDGYHIWGTFEFTCKDSTNNKEYRITEGEFNKLSYY
ncbi:hypothetical protein LAG90_14945 [Marinilongibacter aquaticus]|uniref:hypothetical protein n=1 Tax=Marinilongibacter aquaticus TaxID=2975157 RepID=UPI0021BD60C8|nr:hypothetical protein [Marinilongibacter aquaticus]UBM58101.1 hypothetical protein LAG90_14945 [Marinilongibacter aquaticus]